jgi:2-(1,2-epoxy-1,2-dihydrophenyl)acetyl-CoA isomerase
MADLIETRVDGVVVFTFNRPERMNALSTPITQGLLNRLPELAEDAAVGAIVLTGAGAAFCAGGDVKDMAASSSTLTESEAAAHLRSRMELSRLLHENPKPTIAMVNGPAAGAGMALALACDLRFAGASARFFTAFARIGFSGDFGGSYFLSKLVGTAKARELYYAALPVSAPEALALGMVNRLCADAELEAATLDFARTLARGPRLALELMKQNFNLAEQASLSEVLDQEARHMVRSARTEDHREGARAFVEKRAPVFRGH